MTDRHYDQSQPGYYPPQQGHNYAGSYGSSQQYHPPSSAQYASTSNMHLAPYDATYGHPGSSHSGDSRHRHHRSRSRHSRSRSRASRHSRKSHSSDEERSRSRTRDKIKAHKKEIGASLLGAAAGGAIGHEFGGGGLASVLGVAAGAFAGNQLEKRHEKKKSERKSKEDDQYLAYGDKYGSSQRDADLYDSDDERRRHRHRHRKSKSRSRSRKGRRGSDSDSD